MIRIAAGRQKEEINFLSEKDYLDKYKNTDHQVWIDLINPSKEETDFLSDNFNIHQLAIEDSLQPFHLPKIESFEEYLLVIWQILNDNPKTEDIENSQISFMLGEWFLITIHKDEIQLIEEIFKKLPEDKCILLKGVDWIIRSVLDRSAEGYFPIVDNIDDRADTIEDLIFEDPDQRQLKELFVIKRKLLQIRKVIAPQRDAVSELVRFDQFVKPDNIAYFRDIFDRLVRILDLIDSARDVISGTMDIYLSAVSNRLNEVMKKLTILATIFGPLTIITGIYGMNFDYMPELRSPYGYFGVLAGMILFAIAMFVYFRKKQWW